jgi:hypothetical protein
MAVFARTSVFDGSVRTGLAASCAIRSRGQPYWPRVVEHVRAYRGQKAIVEHDPSLRGCANARRTESSLQ